MNDGGVEVSGFGKSDTFGINEKTLLIFREGLIN
jgi:hypothetical protein